MSLQERTLVVRNFHPERTSLKLLKELFIQAGPVRNIVLKPTHAFVEFEDIESVGYAKALLDGTLLFGFKLTLDPKERDPSYLRYTQCLKDYIEYDKWQRQNEEFKRSFCNYHPEAKLAIQNGTFPQHVIPAPESIRHIQNFQPNLIPKVDAYQQPNTNFFNGNISNPNTGPQTDNLQRSRSFHNHRQGQQNNNYNRRQSGGNQNNGQQNNHWTQRRR